MVIVRKINWQFLRFKYLGRYFTGHTKDSDGKIEFTAGKTSIGDAVDGAIKIFTVAVCNFSILSSYSYPP